MPDTTDRETLAAWFEENLTWDTFQRCDNHELADRLIATGWAPRHDQTKCDTHLLTALARAEAELAALRERIQTLCDHWEQFGDDISITAVRNALDGPS